jgi:hypothetical protein
VSPFTAALHRDYTVQYKYGCHDTQHNDIKHKELICDTQRNNTVIVLKAFMRECRVLFIVMLNVVMLSVVTLSVVAPNQRVL